MTLDTHIYVHDPIGYRNVFAKANQLIGATEATHFRDEDGTIMNEPDQRLPGWLMISYSPDALYRSDDAAAAHLDISLDTAYGYQDELGGCGDLHARFVAALGAWLDSKGVRWSWKNEFTGEIHEGADRLDDLGAGGKQAQQWMIRTVIPALAAELGTDPPPAS